MPYSRNYPATIAEILDPPVCYRCATLAAVRRFARSRPWRGSFSHRRQKFELLHADLCRVYGKSTTLTLGEEDVRDSGESSYSPALDRIKLRGRLSVVTYLHEFAHAIGRDERGACRWSSNLFRACFPRSFARCVADGHLLRRPRSSRF